MRKKKPLPGELKLVYIAGPFRGATAWDIAQNVRAAESVGLEVARYGLMPVIPHANTHLFHGQLTDEFWLRGTLALLRRCDGVMLTSDWTRSTGAIGEAWWALKLRMPVGETPLGGCDRWCMTLRATNRRWTCPMLRRAIQKQFKCLSPATRKMIREL